MSLHKTGVFLASRFGEFSELRAALRNLIGHNRFLPFFPIDLNDGVVSHRPPLQECLANVRRSEFMILLMGDTYGAPAPGSNKSFTQLEYEEAIREESSTRVLVFCVGESYQDGVIRYSSHPMLAQWQEALENRHTLGFIDKSLPAKAQAKEIFDALLLALYEMRFGEISLDESADEMQELLESLPEESLPDDSDMVALESRDLRARGIQLTEVDEQLTEPQQALLRPALAAALEQRQEAEKAIGIRDYGLAVKHLNRALEARPLDLTSCYWLAQIYVALGRKDSCLQAVELAERAANLASAQNLPYRAAGALILAAKAATKADRSGLSFAKRAVEEAPNFSQAHIELARQHVLRDEHELALRSIDQAYRCFNPSLVQVFKDPSFRPVRQQAEQFAHRLKKELAAQVKRVLKVERSLCDLLDQPYTGLIELPEQSSISRLKGVAVASAQRQQRLVATALKAAEVAKQEIEEPSLDDLPLQTYSFPFRADSSAAELIEWKIPEGELIKPGDLAFTYRYTNSSTIRPFEWRNNRVRLYRHLISNGGFFDTSNPELFDFLPASHPILETSRAQAIKQALERKKEQQDKNRNILLQVKSAHNSGQALPLAPIALLLVVATTVWIVEGPEGLSALIPLLLFIVPIWLTFRVAKRLLTSKKRAIKQTNSALQQLDEEIHALHSELHALKSAAAMAEQLAQESINLFETKTLVMPLSLLRISSERNAKEGSLIRLRDRAIRNGKDAFDRELVLSDPLPANIDLAKDGVTRFRLYRVKNLADKRLELSRAAAYQQQSNQNQSLDN